MTFTRIAETSSSSTCGVTGENRCLTNEDDDDEEEDGFPMNLGLEPPPVTPISRSQSNLCVDIGMGEKSDWRSIYVASFLSFCSAVQFSLYFSSLWPFLQNIDKTATERFFGSIVAVYSLGQMLSAPVVGYLSNRFRQIHGLLYVGVALMFFGNGIYLSVQLLAPGQRKFLLLFGRFITGIGSSNISLLKAYASTASVQKDRSRAIAFVTGGVALGATMGPAFQLIFTPIGFPGWRFLIFGVKFRISMYTAPAYMACCMNIVCAGAIYFLFRESYAGIVHPKSHSITVDGQKVMIVPKYDRLAVLLCHITRFTQMFVNTNLETIGASLAAVMFSWRHTQVVEYMATAQAIMSFLAFLTYISYIVFRLDKVVNFRLNCMISLAGLIVFHLLTFSYPFLPGHIQTYNNSDRFSWCTMVRPLNPAIFYSCYILFIGLAFPNINIALNTLFSKIIGPRRQGTQQGILQMSGGSARMVGPVIISYLYTSYGPPMTWMVEIVVISFTLTLWIVFYRRMVPLELQLHPRIVPCTQDDSEHEAETDNSNYLASNHQTRCEQISFVIEPDKEESDEEGQQREDHNNATVSTVCSIRMGKNEQ